MPKKRGPKTDVLEALLKRVDGLEKRLHTEKKDITLDAKTPLPSQDAPSKRSATSTQQQQQQQPQQPPQQQQQPQQSSQQQQRQSQEIQPLDIPPNPSALISPTEPRCAPLRSNCTRESSLKLTSSSHLSPVVVPDVLLDIYFSRIHGKPYHILDENATRQRMQMNQLPRPLAYSIYAVSARYVFKSVSRQRSHQCSNWTRYATHLGGYANIVRIGQEYARRARLELDIDEPSIESLQTLLLLAQAAYQAGRGKKTYMFLCMSPISL